MKIAKLEIENFRALSSFSYDFDDAHGAVAPVTIISGPNGSGKTTILYAITNALRGVLGYRTNDVPVPTTDDLRIPPGYTTGWGETRPNVRVTLDLRFGEAEQEAIREVLQLSEMKEPPPLPDGKVRVVWNFPPKIDSSGNRRDWWQADVEPHKENIRSWLMGRRQVIRLWRTKRLADASLLSQIGGLKLFPQNRILRDRVLGSHIVPQIGEDSSRDTEMQESREPRSAVPELTVSEILEYFTSYAKSQSGQIPDERNWELRVQSLFEKICSPKKYVGYRYREDNPEGAPVLQDGSYQYPLYNAASGEFIILDYITRILYPGPLDNSVILIDEPEMHLHPAWVRRLYMAFPQLGMNNQFIVTTHSPELRQRAAADNCLCDLGAIDPKALEAKANERGVAV